MRRPAGDGNRAGLLADLRGQPAANALVAHNRIDVSGIGLDIDSLVGNVANLTVRDNFIYGASRGVDLVGHAS